ncbi:DNA-directed RNA polymerase subunit delta [Alteribacter natronophilus]|uniref:DNA-directed RNA polymerase subunit delta n=1 Tax=Alteribacter natronophilus TaxID=2583810 RepID=UPI00110F6193|nr:DNA-directed RNA polymerase subunit delta [Alteribacter natronophilus]TMW72140.1 DNA-directed RNA polymerase subunit delta [Alteribacter natronophilus]
MSLKQYDEIELKELSMLEIAYEVMKEKGSSEEYHVLLKQVSEMKEISNEELKDRIANLYTEMSLDGRFVNLGDNKWGLRAWYPFDQSEEELSQTNKPKKKKMKASADEDEDDLFDSEDDDFDEFEDLEDELDELANEEDEDEDFEDEDLDAEEDEDFSEEDDEADEEEDR